MQLPDLVVLVFRLDDQNLDGIGRVYKALREYNSELVGKHIGVLPVISPTWPFVSEQTDKQVLKAKTIFENLEEHMQERNVTEYPLQVSFEAALISKEKIILANKSSYQVMPKIISDYERLVGVVRRFNDEDPLTLFAKARRFQVNRKDLEALKTYARLVTLRPENDLYWNRYANCARPIYQNYKNEVSSFLESFEKEHPKSPYPNIVRGVLEEEKAHQYFAKAIQVRPTLPTAYILRGQKYYRTGNFKEAEQDYSSLVKINKGDVNAFYHRAFTRIAQENIKGALEDIQVAIKLTPREEYYFARAYCYFALGKYSDALNDAARIINPTITDKLFLVHVLSALGREKEARNILKDVKVRLPREVPNVAEAYIVIKDYTSAVNLMTEYKERLSYEDRLACNFLDLFIKCLQGEVVDEDITSLLKKEERSKRKKPRWDLRQLNAFVEKEWKSGNMTDEQHERLVKLIYKFKKHFIVDLGTLLVI